MALVSLTLVALSGCAHQHEALEKRLTALETGLEELKRGDRSTAMRLEDLENRMLLVRDELDTRRTVLYRDRAPAPVSVAVAPMPVTSPSADPLPTVRLTPPEPEPVAPRPETAEPFVYDALDSYGYVVDPAVGAESPAPSSFSESPSVETTPNPLEMGGVPEPEALSAREERRAAGEYKKAFALTKKGRYEKAREAFVAFVAKYPSHQLADNAYYWLGECLYAQKRYIEALQAFQRVIRDYPDGNKVPDAMLKTGLCYQNLGEAAQARRVLAQVVDMYPQSASARVARERARAIR